MELNRLKTERLKRRAVEQTCCLTDRERCWINPELLDRHTGLHQLAHFHIERFNFFGFVFDVVEITIHIRHHLVFVHIHVVHGVKFAFNDRHIRLSLTDGHVIIRTVDRLIFLSKILIKLSALLSITIIFSFFTCRHIDGNLCSFTFRCIFCHHCLISGHVRWCF